MEPKRLAWPHIGAPTAFARRHMRPEIVALQGQADLRKTLMSWNGGIDRFGLLRQVGVRESVGADCAKTVTPRRAERC